jgi:hypothetical protein
MTDLDSERSLHTDDADIAPSNPLISDDGDERS